MNGEFMYSPDLCNPATLQYLETPGLELRQAGPLGAGLYATNTCGSLVLQVRSPYPIVGGRLKVDFARASLQGQLKAQLSFDKGQSWREAGGSYVNDYQRLHIDLNEFFPPAGSVCYSYLLCLELDNPHTASLCLKGLHLWSTLQMARLALPAMKLGGNSFVYTDQSGPGRKVKITHVWRECNSAELPNVKHHCSSSADAGCLNYLLRVKGRSMFHCIQQNFSKRLHHFLPRVLRQLSTQLLGKGHKPLCCEEAAI
jgi:hypothetical protein